jgi:acyl-CoA synthetase (NDP forming)
VRALPAAPDLTIFTAPPDALLGVIDDCAARGVKSVLVITVGFAESFGNPRRFARIADALGVTSRLLH